MIKDDLTKKKSELFSNMLKIRDMQHQIYYQTLQKIGTPNIRPPGYPLIDIIAVTIMGILADANDFVFVYRWAYFRRDWLVSVGLCLNGIPSRDTLKCFIPSSAFCAGDFFIFLILSGLKNLDWWTHRPCSPFRSLFL